MLTYLTHRMSMDVSIETFTNRAGAYVRIRLAFLVLLGGMT